MVADTTSSWSTLSKSYSRLILSMAPETMPVSYPKRAKDTLLRGPHAEGQLPRQEARAGARRRTTPQRGDSSRVASTARAFGRRHPQLRRPQQVPLQSYVVDGRPEASHGRALAHSPQSLASSLIHRPCLKQITSPDLEFPGARKPTFARIRTMADGDTCVFVTGAGSGIGAALCLHAASLGGAVACADINVAAAAETARRCEKLGVRALPLAVNVGSEQSLRAAIDLADAWANIRVFVANAGIMVLGDETAPDDEWDRAWRVNTLQAVYAARALVPRMASRGGGNLVIVASAAGLLTQPGAFPYSVSDHLHRASITPRSHATDAPLPPTPSPR